MDFIDLTEALRFIGDASFNRTLFWPNEEAELFMLAAL
jgi:hypothetical protein